MKTFLLVVSLGGLLAVSLWYLFHDWNSANMSVHGWVALTLGVVLSIGLGAGLMWLVFHSARQGYDDRIEIDHSPDERA